MRWVPARTLSVRTGAVLDSGKDRLIKVQQAHDMPLSMTKDTTSCCPERMGAKA